MERSRDFYFVAYALSRLTEANGKPPEALGVHKWNEAYDLFYKIVGDDRELGTYRNSLKNARDAFDAHFPANPRRGWRDASGDPPALERGKSADTIAEYRKKTDDEVAEQLLRMLSQEDPIEVEGSVFTEGRRKAVISRRIERDPKARREAVKLHGLKCQACSFDFGEFYGPHGQGFVEVHHLKQLSEQGERMTDPAQDLVVLCSNCHRMVHRDRSYCLSLNELRQLIESAKHAKN